MNDSESEEIDIRFAFTRHYFFLIVNRSIEYFKLSDYENEKVSLVIGYSTMLSLTLDEQNSY